MCYIFRLSESLSHSPIGGRDGGKPRLFETLAHNLPREPGQRSGFSDFRARNPLKRLDSRK
jgi:hypothetical protein